MRWNVAVTAAAERPGDGSDPRVGRRCV